MATEYIYSLCDPISNKIRYIGKAKDVNKRFKGHLHTKSKTHKWCWIKNLKDNNLKPILKIIGSYDSKIIGNMERFWINYFKLLGCNLTNHTLGGDGHTGEFSETHKANLSKSQKGTIKTRALSNPIECYNNDKYIKTYYNTGEMKLDGLDQRSVWRVCNGKRLSYKKLKFKYKEV